ncbi:2-keto-4-pentenoate hydratase [Nocardia africana]|uniref:2-keto-4-pentenoate hydratase n=1 Tax=Nocardia africana TaxID=134964 RepID=A0A378WVF7_9NOCA|nr:fumarylacetoacetate hydrolase family protein [Nocardia africana]MCC3313786.1 fumarylacetoacetate hydrolase family protein [Nocardia africana]SUA44832.1 2-keto-4-pentenoate hydratase [Nocardia africana]
MSTSRQIVTELRIAERERKAIEPFSDTIPDLDIATAYAAQARFVQGKIDDGDPVVGAKLGLTSRAKQLAMGVSDPLYGRVTRSMLAPHGEPVDLGTLIQPRVEPEIAFLLGRELAGSATITEVLTATEAVFAALDILDSRYRDYRFTLPDVVADNCSAGRFLLGSTALSPTAVADLRLTGCVLRADGEVVATAAGAAVMGHPAASVAWLVRRLAERGETLPAGSLVFSGGLTAPLPLCAGHCITAEFDGLGTVEAFA